MPDDRTTIVVQRYLDELASLKGDSPAEPIIRDLIARSANRLHVLCSTLLVRSYPRLTRAPLNLQADDMLSAVVDRLLRAMRQVRPSNVRQFFALANQHMRWELNDLARRLDGQTPAVCPSLPGTGCSRPTGDVDRDADTDIFVGAGPGGGPAVRMFDPDTRAEIGSAFFALPKGFRGGLFLAVRALGLRFRRRPSRGQRSSKRIYRRSSLRPRQGSARRGFLPSSWQPSPA